MPTPEQIASAARLVPERNEDGSIKHVIGPNGSRFHVISWSYGHGVSREHCSEPDCEINHAAAVAIGEHMGNDQ